MDRSWILAALALWPAVASATPPTCPVTNTPSQLPTAQQDMAWVGIMNPLAPPATYQICPEDSHGDFKRGFLFDVTEDDCPNGCSATRPVTVELIDPSVTSTPSMISTALTLPPALARFCIYVPMVPGFTGAPQFAPGEMAWVPEQSPMAITASGFDQDLLDYHQQVTAQEVQFCQVAPSSLPPRLTLMDTAETAPESSGADNASHGHVLAMAIEQLACGGGSCPFNLFTRSSMPITDIQPQPTWDVLNGGHFGSLDWLAQAIERELDAWKSSGEPNLVLNLSLAWHEDWGGNQVRNELPDCERPDVLAVYYAIRHARCEGALLFASAGNRTAGGTDTGNMFPGAWADVLLRPEHCLDEFGIVAPHLQPTGSPLVFAVAGVSNDNEPIKLARPDGLPHLLAYADHVAVPGTGAITGNSAATAFASADAALIWSENPGLTPDQVSIQMWDRAVPTWVTPSGPYAALQSWFGGGSTARRIASCGPPAHITPPVWMSTSGPSLMPLVNPPDPIENLSPTGGYLPFATPTPTSTFCPSCSFLVDTSKIRWNVTGLSPSGPIKLALYTSTAPTAPAAQVFNLGSNPSGSRKVSATVVAKRAALMFDGIKDGETVGYLAEVKVTSSTSQGP